MHTVTTPRVRASTRPEKRADPPAVSGWAAGTGRVDDHHRRRRTRRAGRRLLCVAAALVGIALLGACGDGSAESTPLDVDTVVSVEDGTEVTVVGFVRHQGLTWFSADLLHDLDRFEICDVLVMSSPGAEHPTLEICGGGMLELVGVDRHHFEMIGSDVTTGRGEEYWTPEQVVLTGTIGTVDDDRVLTVDRVEDHDGTRARIATGVADSMDRTGTIELTVRAFRTSSGDVTICDGLILDATGARHPFTDEPILEPSGCADPAVRVTNPDELAELRFVPSGAADGGTYTPERILVSGEIDTSDAHRSFTVTEVVASP